MYIIHFYQNFKIISIFLLLNYKIKHYLYYQIYFSAIINKKTVGGMILKYLFLEYPKCTTCKKAKKWLNDNNIEFEDRHIVENNPTKEELKTWFEISGLPIKRFFNTSGMKYRELGLKDKIPNMSEDEMFEILSTDGMLVKRPIIVAEDFILTGFKEKEWEEKLKK